MDEDMQSEESTFVQEDVLAVIKEVHSPRTWELKNSPLGTAHVWHCCPARAQSVDQVLGNATYSHTKVKQWTSQVRVHRRRRASPHARLAARNAWILFDVLSLSRCFRRLRAASRSSRI